MADGIRFPGNKFLDALSSRTIPFRVEFLVSGMFETDLPECTVPEIAIVGRSNVGKSSLINYLAGQKQLARVSSTPGRTQTINLFSVENNTFVFADLPGYGFAESPRETKAHWSKALSRYFEERAGLVGVLFLVDARRDINEEDKMLCRWLIDLGVTVLAVQTKCDKLSKSQLPLVRKKQCEALGVAPGMIVSTSTLGKQGLQELCSGISGIIVGARG
jgi:GTP-binding protein